MVVGGGGAPRGTRLLIDVCRKSDRYFGTIRLFLFFSWPEVVRPGPPRCEPPRVVVVYALLLFSLSSPFFPFSLLPLVSLFLPFLPIPFLFGRVIN